jgi:hypothetical protein
MGQDNVSLLVMTPPAGSTKNLTAVTNEASQWWFFCLLIVSLKFVLLAMDPLPKLFMGDSGSYIWTALTGWIPPDRSYFYGYVIRWSSGWTGSLTSLLVLQVFASAGTAVMVAWICRSIFEMQIKLCFLLGFLCAVDPLQLVWERYVLTETLSLLVYVSVLYWSFHYLKKGRIRDLIIVQGFSVLLIGFRMSYLLVVQVSAFILPIVAFYPVLLRTVGSLLMRNASVDSLKLLSLHLLVSVAVMFAFHSAYKCLNGLMSQQQPAYLYTTGLSILSFWAPALVPEDATDPQLAQIIRQGKEFNIEDLDSRNAQRFAPEGLVGRWLKVEQDLSRANEVARQTALHALKRNPAAIIALAVKNYGKYWSVSSMKRYARTDLKPGDLTSEAPILVKHFQWATPLNITNERSSLAQRYLLGSWPYWFLLLVIPIISGIALLRKVDSRHLILLFVHASVLLAVITTLAPQPSVRYLQPLSLLTILSLAVCIQAFFSRRSATKSMCERAG